MASTSRILSGVLNPSLFLCFLESRQVVCQTDGVCKRLRPNLLAVHGVKETSRLDIGTVLRVCHVVLWCPRPARQPITGLGGRGMARVPACQWDMDIVKRR